jgi:uncharacterized linocin/CFP29 family protein
MNEYLLREDAPLSKEDWVRIDNTVVEVASRLLTGRRFIRLFGPLGHGTQFVTVDRLDATGSDVVSIDLSKRQVVPLVTLQQDFKLLWQDLASGEQTGLKFEPGPAAVASVITAQAEDELIFRGKGGLDGLLTVRGHTTSPLGNWAELNAGITAVAGAVGKLMAAGYLAPFSLVTNPVTYAKLLRPVQGQGAQLEVKLVEQIATGGIFQTPALKENEAVVIASGQENLDLAVGQDLVTAYLGPDGLDHVFRLIETVALRIKRPGAICVLK